MFSWMHGNKLEWNLILKYHIYVFISLGYTVYWECLLILGSGVMDNHYKKIDSEIYWGTGYDRPNDGHIKVIHLQQGHTDFLSVIQLYAVLQQSSYRAFTQCFSFKTEQYP